MKKPTLARSTWFAIFQMAAILFASTMSCSAVAEDRVIGTIEFAVDGEQQTWYVMQPGEDMLPNALWLAMGPEKGAVSITAYRSPDIGFVRHEATGSPVPDGDATAMVVSIGFPLGAGEHSYNLPTQRSDGPATIMILKDWSNPLDAFVLKDGPGEIRLTTIDVDKNGLSHFAGTFSGTMQHDSGATMQIENGRFEIGHVSYFERP
jgi:hypothetical protein